MPIQDIVHLDTVNLDNVINLVVDTATRGEEPSPYLSIAGQVLIAIRSPAHYPHYDTSYLEDHFNPWHPPATAPSPHIWATGFRMLLSAMTSHEPQAAVMSGLSGSGKSFHAQMLIDYIVSAVEKNALTNHSAQPYPVGDKPTNGSDRSSLANMLHPIGVIIDAFGNASTPQNDTSSRLCKITELRTDAACDHIRAVSVKILLLEETRVSHPTISNFHILHLLALSTKATELFPTLNLGPHRSFRILPATFKEIYSPEDIEARFTEFHEALAAIFTPAQIQDIFNVLSAILHLGNLDLGIEGDGEAVLIALLKNIVDHPDLQTAANLMGWDVSLVAETLRADRMKGTDIQDEPSLKRSCAARDSLLGCLYDVLLEWMINDMNAHLSGVMVGELEPSGEEQSFSIIDINSSEQLYINIVNDILNETYSDELLRALDLEYEQEGLPKMTLGEPAISRKGYLKKVVDFLTDSCRQSLTGQVNSDALFRKQMNACFKEEAVIAPPYFDVLHGVSSIRYDSTAIVHKNLTTLNENVLNLVRIADSPVLRDHRKKDDTRPPRGNQFRTHTFLASLRKLESYLANKQKHWIRCIRLGEDLTTTASNIKLDRRYIEIQLRAVGIVATVGVLKSGLSVKISYGVFDERYGLLFAAHAASRIDDWYNNVETRALGCEELLRLILPHTPVTFFCGKSKLYLTPDGLAALEKERDKTLHRLHALQSLSSVGSDDQADAASDIDPSPDYAESLAMTTPVKSRFASNPPLHTHDGVFDSPSPEFSIAERFLFGDDADLASPIDHPGPSPDHASSHSPSDSPLMSPLPLTPSISRRATARPSLAHALHTPVRGHRGEGDLNSRIDAMDRQLADAASEKTLLLEQYNAILKENESLQSQLEESHKVWQDALREKDAVEKQTRETIRKNHDAANRRLAEVESRHLDEVNGLRKEIKDLRDLFTESKQKIHVLERQNRELGQDVQGLKRQGESLSAERSSLGREMVKLIGFLPFPEDHSILTPSTALLSQCLWEQGKDEPKVLETLLGFASKRSSIESGSIRVHMFYISVIYELLAKSASNDKRMSLGPGGRHGNALVRGGMTAYFSSMMTELRFNLSNSVKAILVERIRGKPSDAPSGSDQVQASRRMRETLEAVLKRFVRTGEDFGMSRENTIKLFEKCVSMATSKLEGGKEQAAFVDGLTREVVEAFPSSAAQSRGLE